MKLILILIWNHFKKFRTKAICINLFFITMNQTNHKSISKSKKLKLVFSMFAFSIGAIITNPLPAAADYYTPFESSAGGIYYRDSYGNICPKYWGVSYC